MHEALQASIQHMAAVVGRVVSCTASVNKIEVLHQRLQRLQPVVKYARKLMQSTCCRPAWEQPAASALSARSACRMSGRCNGCSPGWVMHGSRTWFGIRAHDARRLTAAVGQLWRC